MHYNTSPAALAAFFVSLASATLNKPIISPQFPGGGLASLGQGLLDHLAPTQSTFDDWGAGWIAKDCKTLAKANGFSPNDITTFNIKYTDCSDTWVFCRHKNSPMSEIGMIDLFGRLPVRMRSFIRHIIALPGTKSAGSSGDNIQLNGDCDITVFIHETGHSLDSHGFDSSYGVPFSTGKVWVDNYNLDSAVTDSYAQSSQQENFAQETVVSLYDKVVSGGIGTIQPNWQAIFHQYATLQGYAGDKIIPGGSCTNRLANSEPVTQSDSRRGARGLNLANKPDVSLSNNVTVIDSIPMGSTIELMQYDASGKVVGKKVIQLDA